MRKELEYINIEGNYGGDQEWFSYFSMRFGGCAAATACELLMYLSGRYPGLEELYPFNRDAFTKADYNLMGKKMRPYLKPRKNGINRTEVYMDGLTDYMRNETRFPELLNMESFDGNCEEEEAKAFIIKKINEGMPIPYLMLRHTDEVFSDFVWHWFMITGYEQTEDLFQVIIATYGERYTADFHKLWNTGHRHRGGMVSVQLNEIISD